MATCYQETPVIPCGTNASSSLLPDIYSVTTSTTVTTPTTDCSRFSLVNCNDSSTITGIQQEMLSIVSTPMNVFVLLGIHQSTLRTDILGQGRAISGGAFTAFPAVNAFDDTIAEYRSFQRGVQVTNGFCYLGYDFGAPVTPVTARAQYHEDVAANSKNIRTVALRQGCSSVNRVTKVRVERSLDNTNWFGVQVLTLPDNNQRVEHTLKTSAPARYWRLRPLAFNGGEQDPWHVIELTFYQETASRIDNIQADYGFLENRDRNYACEPLLLRGVYTLQDMRSEMSKFGLSIADIQEYTLKFNFNDVVTRLGRPLVIGDIIELPPEAFYDVNLKLARKFVEVTDVAWDTESYTPGWIPTTLRVIAQPAMATQETKDIFGDLNPATSKNDFSNIESVLFNTEMFVADQTVQADTSIDTPLMGINDTTIREFMPSEIEAAHKLNIPIGNLNYTNRPGLYTEDALPPNGQSYTEGREYPDEPTDGAYHRMIYADSTKIPARLYQYSLAKRRWIFKEEDKRGVQTYKPKASRYISDDSAVSAYNIRN